MNAGFLRVQELFQIYFRATSFGLALQAAGFQDVHLDVEKKGSFEYVITLLVEQDSQKRRIEDLYGMLRATGKLNMLSDQRLMDVATAFLQHRTFPSGLSKIGATMAYVFDRYFFQGLSVKAILNSKPLTSPNFFFARKAVVEHIAEWVHVHLQEQSRLDPSERSLQSAA